MFGDYNARNVPLRVDPSSASTSNLSYLEGLDPDRQKRKLEGIDAGGQLWKSSQPFPQSRPWRDVFWAVLFFLTVAVVFALAVISIPTIKKRIQEEQSKATITQKQQDLSQEAEAVAKHLPLIIAAAVLGTIGSLFAALGYIRMAKSCAKCLVYTSLYLASALMILAGLGMISAGTAQMETGNNAVQASAVVLIVVGFITASIGCCYSCCVWCCWGRMIPFTIKVVEAIAEVTIIHPCMLSVSIIAWFISTVWGIIVLVAITGVTLQHSHMIHKMPGGKEELELDTSGKLILAFIGLVSIWSAIVNTNVAHVTYCGVFGRWYFNIPGRAVLPSLCVALTTSFGSICFGSFLVAVVRALDAVVSSAKRDAQKEGDIVSCIIFCCLEMCLSCIGDILEFFNEWAYVQCAIRGSSFCDAAKITFSMMTCANLQYIIADLLVDSVATLGAVFCGLFGAIVAAAVGSTSKTDGVLVAIVCAIFGFLGGLMAGSTCLSVLGSGAKTILVCWADNYHPLAKSNPPIHDMLCEKLQMKHEGHNDAGSSSE